jgi:hypothetical protein
MSYITPKLPKFCMLLDWGTVNNFLNCADIQISIDVELKLLEQIHNLNFWSIFKGVYSFWKNLINSPKILLDMDLRKVNLVGITCI